jgi:hypothetical protein
MAISERHRETEVPFRPFRNEGSTDQWISETIEWRNGTNETAPSLTPHYLVQVCQFILLYGSPLILFPGLVGNTLSFLVMTMKHNRHSSTCFYLAYLAVVDNLVLIFWLGIEWVFIKFKPDLSSLACGFRMTMLYIFTHMESWLVVAVSHDRYIATKHPMEASTILTVARSRNVCIVLTFCFIPFDICYMWISDVFYNPFGDYMQCIAFRPDILFLLQVVTVLEFFLCAVFSFATIFVLNYGIIKEVISASHRRMEIGAQQKCAKSEIRLTRTLISISSFFITCSLPVHVDHLFKVFAEVTYDPNVATDKPFIVITDVYWFNVSILLDLVFGMIYALNCSVNFIFYCVLGGRFRKDVMGLLQRVRK